MGYPRGTGLIFEDHFTRGLPGSHAPRTTGRTTVKGISLGESVPCVRVIVPCDRTSSWFAPRDKAAMLGVNTIFFSKNIAAVTSRADRVLKCDVIRE